MSNFYCTECGTKGIPILRPSNKRREKGHLKNLYCCHCRKEVNHVEISGYNYTYQDFMREFKYGHFRGGKRIEYKDLLPCKNKECALYHHGRCWDARKKKCVERKG